MAGYFGTEAQRRLQARCEAAVAFIAATPGICQNGRMLGCDDLDRLGWDGIDAILAADRACGFRLIPADRVDALRDGLATRGYRLDTWDPFVASRAEALAAIAPILARPLPDGLVELPPPTDPEGPNVARIQAAMAAAGVAPFSGTLLSGAAGPATTVAIADAAGAIVATGHTYRPHNAHSRFRDYTWGGLVTVAESQRGRGLGAWVNARVVELAFAADPAATHVDELIAATNAASRKMAEACGLRHATSLACGAAALADAPRHTR